MPFTNDELVDLSQEVWALFEEIKEVRDASSAQGKKITKKEGRTLLKALLKLASKLAVDIID